MPERLECEVLQKERHINTLTKLPYLLPTCVSRLWRPGVDVKFVALPSLQMSKSLFNTIVYILLTCILHSVSNTVKNVHGLSG